MAEENVNLMDEETVGVICMEMISNVGEGRSKIYEAVDLYANEKYEEDWDVAYKSYFILFSIDHHATVYYKGEWHYDKNGNPTPNK